MSSTIQNDHHAECVARLKRIWEGASERVQGGGFDRVDVGKTMVGVGVAEWLAAEGSVNVVAGLLALIDHLGACGEPHAPHSAVH